MSKTADDVKPNYGPIYAASIYPKLAKVFVEHGYALAVHGSIARDFDLIAVPWIESPSEPEKVLEAVKSKFHVHIEGPEVKLHRRLVYTVVWGFGPWADLSFFPIS